MTTAEEFRAIDKARTDRLLRDVAAHRSSWHKSAALRRGEAQVLREIGRLAQAEHYERAAVNEDQNAVAWDVARRVLEETLRP